MFDFDDLEEDDPIPDIAALARDEAQRAADSLSDPAWNVRRNACKDLGTMGEAARPFLQALKRLVDTDDDFEVQKAARCALKDLRAAGVCIEKKVMNSARQELARDCSLDVLADDDGGFGGSSSFTVPSEQVAVEANASEAVFASTEVPQVSKSSHESMISELRQAHPGHVAKCGTTVWSHEDVGQVAEADATYESCTILEEVSSSDKEDACKRRNYLEKKPPMRDSQEVRMPDDVAWSGHRVNFQINLDVLPMRMERESMLPTEVVDIWENLWGVQYASRLKFRAQPQCESRYLNPREDSLAGDPAIVKVEGAAGILCSLATALRTYGGLSSHEVQLEREKKALELANISRQKLPAPRPTQELVGSRRVDRSKAGLQMQIDMDTRDKERQVTRNANASLKGATRKKHSFGVYAVPDFKSIGR